MFPTSARSILGSRQHGGEIMTTEQPGIAPLPRDQCNDAAHGVLSLREGPSARGNGSKSNVMGTLALRPGDIRFLRLS